MKNLNKLVKSAPLLLLPVAGSALATDLNVPLKFTTLPVITIVEKQALAFGDVLSLTQADTCTMSTSAGTALNAVKEGADLNTANYGNVAATSVGQLSGDCAGAPDGSPGIYEITSFSDADITVSVSAGTDTDISFAAAGYVTNLLEGGTATRETLNTSTPANVNASQALSAYAAAGTNRAIVGGTITNLTALTAGGAYATDFNLNVVYQ